MKGFAIRQFVDPNESRSSIGMFGNLVLLELNVRSTVVPFHGCRRVMHAISFRKVLFALISSLILYIGNLSNLTSRTTPHPYLLLYVVLGTGH